MGPLVVLALALAVAAVGGAVLAGLQLAKGTRRLRAGIEATNARLVPLVEELRAEAAVSATEAEAVRTSLDELSRAREGQHGQARVRSRRRAGLRSPSGRRSAPRRGRVARLRPAARLGGRRRRP